MAPFSSNLIDPQMNHSIPIHIPLTRLYFLPFPVRTCEPNSGNIITTAIHETISQCSLPSTKAQKAALQRHTNPYGNLYGMMFSQSEREKLGIAVKLIEFLCILDDVMEELPYEQSIREHDILCQALTQPEGVLVASHLHGPSTSESLDGMIQFLTQIHTSILDLGVQQGSILLIDLERTLRQRECPPATFSSLEEYLPYRVQNLDWYFVCLLLRWSMNLDISLTPSSHSSSEALSQFESLIGEIGGLSNDYYSWDREKAHYSESGSSDRIMNAVPVLMRQYDVSEEAAKELSKKIIIEKVMSAMQLKEEVYSSLTQESVEEKREMKRYAEALECLAGGYAYWCSTCPRYHAF